MAYIFILSDGEKYKIELIDFTWDLSNDCKGQRLHTALERCNGCEELTQLSTATAPATTIYFLHGRRARASY